MFSSGSYSQQVNYCYSDDVAWHDKHVFLRYAMKVFQPPDLFIASQCFWPGQNKRTDSAQTCTGYLHPGSGNGGWWWVSVWLTRGNEVQLHFSSSCQSGFHLYQKAQIPWSEDLPTPFTSIAGAGFTLWNHSVLLPPGSCKVVSVETVVLHLASTYIQTPQQQALASPSARWFWPRRHSTSTA